MKKKRGRGYVVVACPGCGEGGSVASVAIHQAEELSEYFDVALLSDGFPRQMNDDVERLGVNPARFRWLRRYGHVPNEIAFSLACRRKLFSIGATRSIVTLICHGHPFAYFGGRPLKQKLGVPYVMVVHGDIFDRPEGSYDHRLTAFYKFVTPGAYASANRVIALSPYMRELIIRRMQRHESVVLIPNGIDPTDFGMDAREPVARLGAFESPLQLLYVGRLGKEKGVETLVAACELLKSWCLDFRLRVVGSGPEAFRLNALVERLGLQGNVVFVGNVERGSLANLYRSSHIVCVPSRNDTLPTVVLEAMSAGCAVVGSNIGGIPFMLGDGRYGLLHDPDRPDELAVAIRELADDRSHITTMGGAGARFVAERFSWTYAGQELARLVSQLAA